MRYERLSDEQVDAIRQSHVDQVEQQHASATVQFERDKAAGRETQSIEALIAQLEAEHAQLTKKPRAK